MSSIVCLTCVILFQGVPTTLQDLEPTETFLRQLSRWIGKEVFQLAIELELTVPDYENIEYEYAETLPGQVYAVLRKWKQSRNSPTVKQLVNAISRINRDVKSIVKLLKEYYSITKMWNILWNCWKNIIANSFRNFANRSFYFKCSKTPFLNKK